jgi:hypothetical protein
VADCRRMWLVAEVEACDRKLQLERAIEHLRTVLERMPRGTAA